MTDPHKNSTVKKVNFKLRKKNHCFNIVVLAAGKSRKHRFNTACPSAPGHPLSPTAQCPAFASGSGSGPGSEENPEEPRRRRRTSNVSAVSSAESLKTKFLSKQFKIGKKGLPDPAMALCPPEMCQTSSCSPSLPWIKQFKNTFYGIRLWSFHTVAVTTTPALN